MPVHGQDTCFDADFRKKYNLQCATTQHAQPYLLIWLKLTAAAVKFIFQGIVQIERGLPTGNPLLLL